MLASESCAHCPTQNQPESVWAHDPILPETRSVLHSAATVMTRRSLPDPLSIEKAARAEMRR